MPPRTTTPALEIAVNAAKSVIAASVPFMS